METMQIWNKIVDEFNKCINKTEMEIQRNWEAYFIEILGYSRFFRNEIDTQRTLPLGTKDKLIPDIILRRSNNDLFVFEQKRLNLRDEKNFLNQLVSYMKQLHLSVGVLVCNVIVICFYDFVTGEYIKTNIEFIHDNEDGKTFLTLFQRENFDVKNINDFIKKTNIKHEEFKREKEQEAIRLTKLSQNTMTVKDSQVYDEPNFDYVIIKTKDITVKERGSRYEATRKWWKVGNKIRNYKIVFSVTNKVVQEVYMVEKWHQIERGLPHEGRYEFFGKEADRELANKFIGKTIPAYYRKLGMAAPVLFKI